ncbi:MAG: hypothetical protein JWO05_762 [Gemmatimonadetes bacterium]|nr:hypothetical protein [Gemmatimonadota bacterium]
MTSTRTLLPSGILALLAAACINASAAPRQEGAINAALAHYASTVQHGPVDSLVACYEPDGTLELPGMDVIRGRESIKQFLLPLARAVEVKSVTLTSQSLAVHGATAEQSGEFRQVAGPPNGATQEFRGRFHASWKRGDDRQWRIARLVMQPDK